MTYYEFLQSQHSGIWVIVAHNQAFYVNLNGNLPFVDFSDLNPIEKDNFEFDIEVISDLLEFEKSGGRNSFFNKTFRNKDCTAVYTVKEFNNKFLKG